MGWIITYRGFVRAAGSAAVAACLVLASCTVDQKRQASNQPDARPAPAQQDRISGPVRPSNATAQSGKIAEIYPATAAGKQGNITLPSSSRPTSVAPRTPGDITLNFEEADIREVAQVILRDLMKVNYVIDPDVRGQVTFRTANPLTREQLLPAFETLLRANGLGLAFNSGFYRVTRGDVARSDGTGAGTSGGAGGPVGGRSSIGSVRVFPLKFVSAEEIGKILKPIVGEGHVLMADALRGIVVVGGGSDELRLASETIAVFDVDMMAGQTVLLESLQNADAATLALELENLFQSGKSGSLEGAVRIMPIERLNAIMIIAAQPRYIEEARNWIARLDRTRNAQQRRLFVYYLQNAKAAAVGRTLRGIFGLGEVGSADAATALRGQAGGNASAMGRPTSAPRTGVQTAAIGAATPAGGAADQARSGINDSDSVRIFADEANNAILVLANSSEYQSIEETLLKLDLVPLQVLIEASIVEVALNDALRFGVQYYLDSGSSNVSGVLSAGQPALPPNLASTLLNLGSTAQAAGGLSLFVSRGGQPRVLVDALSSLTEVNMVSSPSLLVLDNQLARLQVGATVPIITQSVVAAPTGSVTPAGNSTNIANAIDYRETGVLLEVLPRVNASGLITLEIAQEVSDVSQPAVGAAIQSPTINQRRIVSTVAVNSGDSVVLGGLIRDSQAISDSGIPILHSIPVIGALFGQKGNASSRTELLVMLTPRIIRNQREARDVSNDLQRKFQAVLSLMGRGLPPPRRPSTLTQD